VFSTRILLPCRWGRWRARPQVDVVLSEAEPTPVLCVYAPALAVIFAALTGLTCLALEIVFACLALGLVLPCLALGLGAAGKGNLPALC
jgi:hypothetical protein